MHRLIVATFALVSVIACDRVENTPAPTTVAPPQPTNVPASPPTVAAETTTAAKLCGTGTTQHGAAPPEATELWCARPDGTRHGAYVAYFPVGGKRVQGLYDEGKEHGVWQEYFDGGGLRSERIYDRGRPTGKWHTYFPEGHTATETTHISATEEHLTEYRADGARLREGPMRGGARNGTWHEWSATGALSTTDYLDGKPGKTPGGSTTTGGASGIEIVGIAQCDEYIEKYTRCIRDKVPEPARESMEEAMAATTKAWKEAADGPARPGLETACTAALDAARQATKAMGCVW